VPPRVEEPRWTVSQTWSGPPGKPMPPEIPKPPTHRVPPHLWNEGRLIALDLKGASPSDVVDIFTEQCHVNIVMPDWLKFAVTVHTKLVPCAQAFEVILESHDLRYEYEPDINLLRVTSRVGRDQELDQDAKRDDAALALEGGHDPIPDGRMIDLDVKNM